MENIKQNIMDMKASMETEQNGEGQNTEDLENLTNAINSNEIGINITNKEVVNETNTTISGNVVESTLNYIE